jgi:hypothetical protein
VIFFENIGDSHRPSLASLTLPAMMTAGRFAILAHGRPIGLAGSACGLRKSMISPGNMVYNR